MGHSDEEEWNGREWGSGFARKLEKRIDGMTGPRGIAGFIWKEGSFVDVGGACFLNCGQNRRCDEHCHKS